MLLGRLCSTSDIPCDSSQTISEAMPGNIAKYIFAHAPDSLLAATGSMLYKYMG